MIPKPIGKRWPDPSVFARIVDATRAEKDEAPRIEKHDVIIVREHRRQKSMLLTVDQLKHAVYREPRPAWVKHEVFIRHARLLFSALASQASIEFLLT
jgi:hypothetical protein